MFRYNVNFVDTKTDEVVMTRRADTLKGVKRRIGSFFYPEKYTGLEATAVYIQDLYAPHEAYELTAEIMGLDLDLLLERGVDFDVWHDAWLLDHEREEFDKTFWSGDPIKTV